MAKEKESFKHNFYIGNKSRIVILLIMFIILIVLAIGYYIQVKNFSRESYNTYVEVSNVNYQVLYNNGLYDKDTTNKYNSNLIKNIDFDLTYRFNAMKKFNTSFDYKVVGKLKIKNKDKKEVYTKTYDLIPYQTEIINNDNGFDIEKSISFDYLYYYSLVNGLKTKYNFNTNAVYEITLLVNNKFSSKTVESTPNEKLLVSIPLDNGDVTIANKLIDNADKYINAEFVTFINMVIIIMAMIIVLIGFLLFLLYSIKQHKHEKTMNEYEKKIEKILGTYDRLIVNISVMPDLDDYKVNKIKEFKELLDVAKGYNEPIRFIEVNSKKKANFIVRHKDEIFIYTVTNKK